MISKTGYHAYNVSFLVIVCVIVVFLSGAIGTAFPLLDNGKLYIAPSVSVPIEGTVLEFSLRDTAILYVAQNEKEIVAGAYTAQDKNITQFTVTSYSENMQIKRIAFESGAIYICIREGHGILYRADVNKGIVEKVESVSDFLILAGGLVILKNDNTLVHNDFIIPLYFTGNPVIKGQIDNRIVFIADDNDTEVIDIKTKRVIYRYSNYVEYAATSDYTVEIKINDLPTAEKASRVFYKVYCDGQDYGRTEPVLSINESSIQLNVAAGQYHEIIVERWRLDERENQYVRDNNIRQPRPITVFVHPGRIMVFTLVYNGVEYKVTSGFKILEK